MAQRPAAAAVAAGHAVVRADVGALPLREGSVDAVVVSLALILAPLQATLGEVARVLRPGGVLVTTVPHPRPLPPRDWVRDARLCLALRHPALHYPNDVALRAPAARLSGFVNRRGRACVYRGTTCTPDLGDP